MSIKKDDMPDDIAKTIADVKAKTAKDGKQEIVETKQIVVFHLDGEEYGVFITDIKEIITMSDVTPLPNAPSFISGILNVRGTIVVVVDLEERFGLKREGEHQQKHIILTEVEESTFGIIVDTVEEVLAVPASKIKESPELVSGRIHTDYLHGVVVIGEEQVAQTEEGEKQKGGATASRLIILLDIKKMLEAKELLQVSSLIKES